MKILKEPEKPLDLIEVIIRHKKYGANKDRRSVYIDTSHTIRIVDTTLEETEDVIYKALEEKASKL